MKEDEEEDETYEVRLLCRSCQHDWVKDIDRGVYVRSKKDNNYMIEKKDSKEKHKYFTCPNCGAHTKIARLPIKDWKG